MYEFLPEILSLGVGGVLAVIIFLMYRRDMKEWSRRLNDISKDLNKSRSAENRSRDRNTKVLSELSTLVKKLNGKRD